MGAGDLFELLVALAIIVFGLLGVGSKKKEQQRQRPERPRRPTPQSPEGRGPPEERDELLSEIDRILRGQVPERGPVPPPEEPEPDEAISLEPLETDSYAAEEVSLERLEIDAEARHDRFHDKYIRPLAPHPGARRAAEARAPRAETHVARIPLRQAVIWREILGPPKGLQ